MVCEKDCNMQIEISEGNVKDVNFFYFGDCVRQRK